MLLIEAFFNSGVGDLKVIIRSSDDSGMIWQGRNGEKVLKLRVIGGL